MWQSPAAGNSRHDTQLDKLVYALYGLTDAEIKIVEQAA